MPRTNPLKGNLQYGSKVSNLRDWIGHVEKIFELAVRISFGTLQQVIKENPEARDQVHFAGVTHYKYHFNLLGFS